MVEAWIEGGGECLNLVLSAMKNANAVICITLFEFCINRLELNAHLKIISTINHWNKWNTTIAEMHTHPAAWEAKVPAVKVHVKPIWKWDSLDLDSRIEIGPI